MKKAILVVSLMAATLGQPAYASYICSVNNKSLHADANSLASEGSEGSCESLGFDNDVSNSAYVKKYTLSNPNSPGCDLTAMMPGMPDMGGFLSGNLQMGIDLCSAMQEGLDFFSDEANQAVGGMFSQVESTVQDALNEFAGAYADSMPNLVEETFNLDTNTTIEFNLSEGETIGTAIFDHLGNETSGTQAESAINNSYQSYEDQSGIQFGLTGNTKRLNSDTVIVEAQGTSGTLNDPANPPSGYAGNNMPSSNGPNALPTFNSSGLISAN